MFQKIFLLTLCLILSACGNTEAPSKTVSSVHTSSKIETFESNYARIIESTLSLSSTGLFSVLQDFSSSLSPSGYDTSVIRVAFGIPTKISGDISLGADAIRETYKKLSAKISLTGSLTNMSGETISLQDIRGQLMINAEKSRYYGIIEALDIVGIPETMTSQFEEIKKYMGKWWILDYGDIMPDTLAYDRNHGGNLRNFITGYSSLIQDLMGNGTKNIIPLIEKNPFIMTSSSGIIRENEYIYPIVLSPTGISGFLEDLSIFYAGSGISQDMKRELTGFLEGMTSTGELHISTLEPTYFSLSLSMTASGVGVMPIEIDISSKPENFTIKASTQSGSITSTYTHKNGEKARYILNVTEGEKSHNIIEYAGNMSSKNIDGNFVFFDPSKENTVSTTIRYLESDGTFAYTLNQSKGDTFSDIINLSGIYQNKKVISLTGSFTLPGSSKDILSLGYNRSDDDSFTLKIQTPSGKIDSDGSLKKNNIKINLNAQGFSATFEQKTNENGSSEGKLQLPVGLVRWNGKIENEILTDLHIKGASPFVGFDLDLIQTGDSVSGPYSLTQGGRETSSGTIILRKIPKNFDVRIDTILPTMDTASFFEFHNFTDLRWDENAKVIEPESAESLTPLLPKNTRKIQESPLIESPPPNNSQESFLYPTNI